MRVFLAAWFVALVVPPAVAAQTPGERYYLTLFGVDSHPRRIRQTHTFAVFARTVPNADGTVAVEAHTVSWMPASLMIRPLALRPEPGVNLSLADTYRWIASFDGHVSVWGPYEIGPERYYPAVERKAELESGAIAYRAIGGFTRSAPVSNCGQSFSRAGPVVGRKYLQPTPRAGEVGTGHLATRYLRAGAFLDPHVRHTWLLPILGADQYPITVRQTGERIPLTER